MYSQRDQIRLLIITVHVAVLLHKLMIRFRFHPIVARQRSTMDIQSLWLSAYQSSGMQKLTGDDDSLVRYPLKADENFFDSAAEIAAKRVCLIF